MENDLKNKTSWRGKTWVSYEEAQAWAISKGITTVKQWRQAIKEPDFPDNIPSGVDHVYSDFTQRGGWGAFLKTSRIATNNRKESYLSYEEAKQWAADNQILTRNDWLQAKLPSNIPRTLSLYPEYDINGGFEGFSSVPRFNNTSIIERVIRIALDSVFAEQENPHRRQKVVCATKTYQVDMLYEHLNLVIEYDGVFFHKNKLNLDIQKTNDLKQMGLHLIRIRESGLPPVPGQEKWDVELKKTDTTTHKIQTLIEHLLKLSEHNQLSLSLEEKENLKNIVEHGYYQKFAEQVRTYAGRCTYEEAQKWAQDNSIKTSSEWFKADKPSFIPVAPNQYYLDFTKLGGWGAFLGTQAISNEKKKEQFVSYEEAQKWAQENNIKNTSDWRKAAAIRPSYIPSNPEKAYPEQFTQLHVFLGTPEPYNQKKNWVPYEEAKQWGVDNNIKNSSEWKKIPKEERPFLIPSEPEKAYPDFYKRGGWGTFLEKQPKTTPKLF